MNSICTVVTNGGDEVIVVVAGDLPLLTSLVRDPSTGVRAGCRGGGCGVCRVRIVAGDYSCRRMSRRFVSEDDERSGYVLSCRVLALGDLVVETMSAV